MTVPDPRLQMRIDDYHREDLAREDGCFAGVETARHAYRQTSDLVGELLTLVDAQETELRHLQSLLGSDGGAS